MGAYMLNVYLAVVVQLSNIMQIILKVFRSTYNTHVLTNLLRSRVINRENATFLQWIAQIAQQIPHELNFPPTQPMITLVYDDVNGQAMEVAIDPNDLDSIPVPTNFKQARSSTQWLRWKESMDKEIKDLLIHDTWETMKRSKVPSGRKVTKSKWVYTIKYNRDGTIERFKSRFVACGYSQVEGEDYSHSFSALMLVLAARA